MRVRVMELWTRRKGRNEQRKGTKDKTRKKRISKDSRPVVSVPCCRYIPECVTGQDRQDQIRSDQMRPFTARFDKVWSGPLVFVGRTTVIPLILSTPVCSVRS